MEVTLKINVRDERDVELAMIKAISLIRNRSVHSRDYVPSGYLEVKVREEDRKSYRPPF